MYPKRPEGSIDELIGKRVLALLGNVYAEAVSYRDLPMIQSIVLLFATIIVLVNLLAVLMAVK